MTNHWVDIKNSDLIVVMGGNAAEAHPVGFRWAIEARNKNNAKILVIDPRFTRSAAVADKYVPLRPGTDIAFLNGVINYVITNNKYQQEYVRDYTNASFLVRDDYDFNRAGLFSGWDDKTGSYDKSSWAYQFDEEGFAKRDMSLTDERTVWKQLVKHVSRYTPEMVSKICGTTQADFLEACEMIAETGARNKVMTSLYALGWTEHTIGSQIIRNMAVLQLVLGNIGLPGGGINALRGHCNVQGITDIGPMATALPAYMALPNDKHVDLATYLEMSTPKMLAKGQVNYWSNYPKFFVSLLKSFYGDSATPENSFGYDWLPKWDKSYDTMHYMQRIYKGKVNGFLLQGYNIMNSMPETSKTVDALKKLKFLVVIDPMDCETANFWKNMGEYNDVNSEEIDTVVFNLPSSLFAEEEGSLTNSGRWLQWHWAGVEPPGEGKTDSAIIAELMLKLQELYKEKGGKVPEAVVNMTWNYSMPHHPSSEEVAKEMNGKALADLKDADGNIILKKGQQLSSFGQLRDDGSTASACWIYTGCWTEAGNQMAKRDNADPSGLGNHLGWSWAWPLNRRILYNRASLDRNGKPWDPKRQIIRWEGTKWSGFDVPDFTAAPPGSDVNPFIMQADGVGGLFAQAKMAEGPFPEHYEPVESPIGVNYLHTRVGHSPTVRIFEQDLERIGTPDKYPYVCTTYRLTEHFHTLTKNSKLNAITQPEAFAEISETLAQKIGVKAGDMIKVYSLRGYVKVKAVVTKRIKQLDVNGNLVEVVGLPIHWGIMGEAVKSNITNRLTPSIGDSNTQTPEFKTFLVNVEKV